MDQYEIECEECENVTHVFAYEFPEFCPICGSRVEAEGVEYADDENELKAILDY